MTSTVLTIKIEVEEQDLLKKDEDYLRMIVREAKAFAKAMKGMGVKCTIETEQGAVGGFN